MVELEFLAATHKSTDLAEIQPLRCTKGPTWQGAGPLGKPSTGRSSRPMKKVPTWQAILCQVGIFVCAVSYVSAKSAFLYRGREERPGWRRPSGLR